MFNENLKLNLTIETAPAIKSTAELTETLQGITSQDRYLFIARPDNPEEYRGTIETLSLEDNLTLALVKKTEEIPTTATAQILKAYFDKTKIIVVMPELITDKEWREELRSVLLTLQEA